MASAPPDPGFEQADPAFEPEPPRRWLGYLDAPSTRSECSQCWSIRAYRPGRPKPMDVGFGLVDSLDNVPLLEANATSDERSPRHDRSIPVPRFPSRKQSVVTVASFIGRTAVPTRTIPVVLPIGISDSISALKTFTNRNTLPRPPEVSVSSRGTCFRDAFSARTARRILLRSIPRPEMFWRVQLGFSLFIPPTRE